MKRIKELKALKCDDWFIALRLVIFSITTKLTTAEHKFLIEHIMNAKNKTLPSEIGEEYLSEALNIISSIEFKKGIWSKEDSEMLDVLHFVHNLITTLKVHFFPPLGCDTSDHYQDAMAYSILKGEGEPTAPLGHISYDNLEECKRKIYSRNFGGCSFSQADLDKVIKGFHKHNQPKGTKQNQMEKEVEKNADQLAKEQEEMRGKGSEIAESFYHNDFNSQHPIVQNQFIKCLLGHVQKQRDHQVGHSERVLKGFTANREEFLCIVSPGSAKG